MTVIIDNYDSFSYNLYQMVGEMDPDVAVLRNDVDIEDIERCRPDRIVISPGPGRPENAGNILEIINYYKGSVPILGICLGHQAICMSMGGEIVYASRLMHGKQSLIDADISSVIFDGCCNKMPVARYHSLAADRNVVPEELRVIATADDGEIMAVEHMRYPIYGLQFHPESIMTPEGRKIISNFLNI